MDELVQIPRSQGQCQQGHFFSFGQQYSPTLGSERSTTFFFFLRFMYLFYVYEYTVAEQMVVSLHVLVGN